MGVGRRGRLLSPARIFFLYVFVDTERSLIDVGFNLGLKSIAKLSS